MADKKKEPEDAGQTVKEILADAHDHDAAEKKGAEGAAKALGTHDHFTPALTREEVSTHVPVVVERAIRFTTAPGQSNFARPGNAPATATVIERVEPVKDLPKARVVGVSTRASRAEEAGGKKKKDA